MRALSPRTGPPAAQGRPTNGFVTDSVVAIVTRAGNPLGITGWNSLTKSGVQIVTPDPISSGSARWNLLAAYESQIQQGKSATQATNFVNSLVANVVSEPSSGSKALTTFESGTGNVLLAYESDALTAKAAGGSITIVNPAQNTLIQNPGALTTTGAQSPAAVAFYDFLYSRAGQEIWVQQNFRGTIPYVQSLKKSVFYQPTRDSPQWGHWAGGARSRPSSSRRRASSPRSRTLTGTPAKSHVILSPECRRRRPAGGTLTLVRAIHKRQRDSNRAIR